MIEEEKHILILSIYAQGAESGPPLGTVLGNLGINAVKFCKEFNEFSKDLPIYFKLKVKIFILENKNYHFTVEGPSTGHILSLLKFEKDLIEYVKFDDLVKLSKFKFPFLPLTKSIKIILGSVNSGRLEVSNEDEDDSEFLGHLHNSNENIYEDEPSYEE